MEGRCYGCAVKFTLFRKECGCKSCGRAFCSNCLCFSAAAPRSERAQHKVCRACHEALARGPSEAGGSQWSPPGNYKKRVAALEAKQQLLAPQGTARFQGLSPEDLAIARRLEKLRQGTTPSKGVWEPAPGLESSEVVPSQAEIEARLTALQDQPRGPIPSTEEIEERLAVLQGRVPPSQAPRPVHQPPDTRTQAQQAEDLLTQLAAEVAIDESCDGETPAPGVSLQNDLNRDSPRGSNIGPAELAHQQLEGEKGRLLAEAAAELREENTRQERILALAKRLAVLRGLDPEGVTLQNYHFPDSDEDEEEAIQRVLQQLTEEAALEEASGFNIPAKQGPPPRAQPKAPTVAPKADSEAEEELPWCCICNEDATLRCYGCDGDLYCPRCFREGHDAFERKEHRTSIYHPPCTRGEH
ncbi:abscission/NoCut checkpoint regulator isoform X2 [Sminthopsis crassicaudata]|uniref:abscission/NoCut checkpoint regulator isoform X2 n=1 Tax=Sminthopsis crassicaudata TaxID=9301 RepID=UPI003D69BE57